MKALPKSVSFLLLSIAAGALFVLGCGDGSTKTKEQDKVYDIKGKVMEVDAAQKKVKLDHEDIPGFMKGMKMNFKVEDASVLEGLKAGDEVHGRLKVKAGGDYVITELHKDGLFSMFVLVLVLGKAPSNIECEDDDEDEDE